MTGTGHGRGRGHRAHDDHKNHQGFVVFVIFVTFVIAAVARCSAQAPPAPAPAQPPPAQAPSASRFDGNRAFQDLREQVAIGPRPAGSAAIKQTRDYIKKQLTAAGLTPVEQAFEAQTPTGRVQMVNIRATLPGPSTALGTGQTQDRGRIVIGGHYDT